jgi:anti-sigma factor RsiW
MRNDEHLSEETLNAYLDVELGAGERDRAEVHLATCETCYTEMQALQNLFTVLNKVADVPAPNLVAGVLTQVRPRRKLATLHWLIPTFQGSAAVALLAWGWTRLISYWAVVVNALPTKGLSETGKQAGEWIIAQWAALNTLPNVAWSGVQDLIARLTPSSSPSLSLPQLIVAGVVLGMLWLVCNVTLLRRSLLNGHKTQS